MDRLTPEQRHRNMENIKIKYITIEKNCENFFWEKDIDI